VWDRVTIGWLGIGCSGGRTAGGAVGREAGSGSKEGATIGGATIGAVGEGRNSAGEEGTVSVGDKPDSALRRLVEQGAEAALVCDSVGDNLLSREVEGCNGLLSWEVEDSVGAVLLVEKIGWVEGKLTGRNKGESDDALILEGSFNVAWSFAGKECSSKMTWRERYTLSVRGSRHRYPAWLYPKKMQALDLYSNLWDV